MTYIMLAAGVGSRLKPLTLSCPKCLFSLHNDKLILQRTIDQIRRYDCDAKIVTVVGFMQETVKESISGTDFIQNPFYETSNSIASLWFARDFLLNEVTIINSDVVMEDSLVKDVVTKSVAYPTVLLDSSVKANGDYNVQVQGDDVLVMSKDLNSYYGEYAGVSKISTRTVICLRNEVQKMMDMGHCDQWYENALVQMIFNSDLKLKYKDIINYEWTEVDCVDDLLKAKAISYKDKE
jgi:L-glutamine-phosphate cytidylyltransferase